jgi:signal transduction histidine kinase
MSSIAPPRSRHSRERDRWPARARRLAFLPTCLVVAISAITAVAAVLGFGAVLKVGPGDAYAEFNGALAFLLVGTALLLPPRSRGRRICYALTLAITSATLAQDVFSVDLGIDELVTEDPYFDEAHPGRPARMATIGLAVLSLGGLLTELGRRTTAQVMAGAGLLTGMTGTYGYLYGVDGFYRVGETAAMSLSASVGMVVASLLVWLSVPQGALQWVTFGADSGARAQRVLVPVALVLIPVVAWLFIQGHEAGLYGISFGTAMFTSFATLVIVVVGYRTGRTAFRMDLERDTLLDELHRVNSELEDRVRVKVHQLNRQRTKLALFEERDRIARDLHDRVIQRIFAGGLQVASLSRTARRQTAAHGLDSSVAEGLDLIAVELDLAIRELRNSIFELTSIGDHDNVEQVVRDIAARAARILGFMPRVEVSGELAGVSADLVAHLASVVQEGLSNVARHARASAAQVAVSATADDLQVTIVDDGIGLPDPLPRSSGVSNLMNRARQLGGTATWANAEPHGTALTWRVPRSGQPLEEPHGYTTPVASSDSDHRAPAAVSS